MKILVLDGNELHRQAAVAQFSKHELTVVGSYIEAETVLKKGQFDVFLTDLFLPAPAKTTNPESSKLIGAQMPIGTIIALLATRQPEMRYVGILTAPYHHTDHPASACIDPFNTVPIRVGVCKMLMANCGTFSCCFDKSNLNQPLTNCPIGVNSVCSKNWKAFLEYVIRRGE